MGTDDQFLFLCYGILICGIKLFKPLKSPAASCSFLCSCSAFLYLAYILLISCDLFLFCMLGRARTCTGICGCAGACSNVRAGMLDGAPAC